jgi:glycosyltransferase involved in cell wall biosynthesis
VSGAEKNGDGRLVAEILLVYLSRRGRFHSYRFAPNAAADMSFSLNHDVLLFYEDWDTDRFVSGGRHVRRALRKLYRAVRRGKPKVTGFEVWFRLLKRALEFQGVRVHVNDFRLARANPKFPVGLTGYPHILHGWDLQNPAVLGPGMIDHPSIDPNLMKDPRYRVFVTTCDWYHDMFSPVYGEACGHWHGGFDLAHWPALTDFPKDIDVLVYDKVRWDRDRYEPEMITPIRKALDARGLRHTTIRYGHYDWDGYKRLMERSRALLFLCEHETQGMAYQEAMASGLPVLAWDPGTWVDPNARKYDPNPIKACSVPFFSEKCGERFTGIGDFEAALDRFWPRIAEYRPRDYVSESLSMKESAETYVALLRRAAGE